jgi:uncharacterized protein
MSTGGDWKDMFSGVERNDPTLVKYYINEGIDLNFQHPEYLTSPLIESVRLGHLEITRLLIDHGADPRLVEVYSNKSPLEVAYEVRNLKAVALLEGYYSWSWRRWVLKWWRRCY